VWTPSRRLVRGRPLETSPQPGGKLETTLGSQLGGLAKALTAVDRLGFIRAAQAVGLSLGEIRGIVALRDGGDTPCGHVVNLLQARSAELDRRIADLHSLRGELHRLVELAESLDPADCDPRAICHIIARPAR